MGKLKLLASARSAGKKVAFAGGEVEIEEARPEAFEGCDIVLGAVDDDIAREMLPKAVEGRRGRGRQQPRVPSRPGCAPGRPRDQRRGHLLHHGIIANPNCATIIGLVPTWPLHKVAGVTRMIVSTYQAASGAGAPGMAELEAQIAAMGRGEDIPEPRAFAAQLVSNLIRRSAASRRRATPPRR